MKKSKKILLNLCASGLVYSVLALPSYAQQTSVNSASTKKPNVIYIFTDDQRADTIGAFGNTLIKTPNIDKLAQRSFNFSNAYNFGGNVAAVCIPARNMTMTGQTHFRFKGKKHSDGKGVTFPKQMSKLGYQTWYREKSGTANLPHIRTQFDAAEDIKMLPALASGYAAKSAIDDTIQFLSEEREEQKPFFIYLGLPAPHDPRWAAKEFRDLYDVNEMKLPKTYQPVHKYDMGMMTVRDERLEMWPRSEDAIKRHVFDYYALISAVDHDIGRLMDYLATSGLDDNTIIVYASDQGLALGSHGLMGKQSLYEDVQKIPLFISGPNITAGQSDAFVYHHDILPTIVDLISGHSIPNIDGKSLKQVMKGKANKVRDNLVMAYTNSQRTIRIGDWKLYQLTQINQTMLFNLATDPHEQNDLSADITHSARIIEMLDQLRFEQQQLGDTLPLFTNSPKSALFVAPKHKLPTPYAAGGLAPGIKPPVNPDFLALLNANRKAKAKAKAKKVKY